MFVPLRQEYVLTRNQMARQIRKKSGTGVYHVMLRGINRQDIFEDDEDYQQMVSILRSMTDRHDDDGALMPPLCTYQNPLKAGIVEKTEDYPWSSWKEYDNENCRNSLCSTHAVFSRISREDLKEQVCVPVEGYDQILDIDAEGIKAVSDGDVKAFLHDKQGIINPLMIQSLEKTRRNVVLRSALSFSFGAGIRQLSRLTGISFGVIQKLKNDQERSALPLSLNIATERTVPADRRLRRKTFRAVRAE